MSKGFIATQSKDLALAGTLLEGVFRRYVAYRRDIDVPRDDVYPGSRLKRMKDYNVNIEFLSGGDGLSFNIKTGETVRTVSLYLYCDSDHEDVAPRSLSMLMGSHGDSEVIMQCALYALSPLGQPFYLSSEYSDAPHVKLPPSWLEISVGDLLAQSALSGRAYEHLIRTYQDGQSGLNSLAQTEDTFYRLFGISYPQYADLQKIKDPSERWKALANATLSNSRTEVVLDEILAASMKP